MKDIYEGKKSMSHGDVAIKLLDCDRKKNDCNECPYISSCIHYLRTALATVYEFIEGIQTIEESQDDDKKRIYK